MKDPNMDVELAAQRKKLSERLRDAVRNNGGNSAVAGRANISESTLNKWLGGAEPGVINLLKFAEATNTSIDYLVGRVEYDRSADNIPGYEERLKYHKPIPEEEMEGISKRRRRNVQRMSDIIGAQLAEAERNKPDLSDFVRIPRLEIKASAGAGLVALQSRYEAENSVAFQEKWLRSLGVSPQNAEFLEVEGDSMEPTIMDGDLILIDRGYNRVLNGKIYVIVANDVVLVKRINLLATGGAILISDNERYPSENIAASDINSLSIEGRVRWYGRAI